MRAGGTAAPCGGPPLPLLAGEACSTSPKTGGVCGPRHAMPGRHQPGCGQPGWSEKGLSWERAAGAEPGWVCRAMCSPLPSPQMK